MNNQNNPQEIKASWEAVLRVHYNLVEKGIDNDGWYSNQRNGQWLPLQGDDMKLYDFRNNNTEVRPKSLGENNPQEVPQVKSVEEEAEDKFWEKQRTMLKLESRIAELEAENDRLKRDKEIVDFIMDVDWMGTKEFCDKHNFSVPYYTGSIDTSARLLVDVDMKRWHVVKDFAKQKRNEQALNSKEG